MTAVRSPAAAGTPATAPVADTPPAAVPVAVRRRRGPRTAARLAALQALVLAVVLGGSVVAMWRNSQSSDHAIVANQLAAELHSFQSAALARPPSVALGAFATAYLRTHAVASGDAVVIAVDGAGAVGSANAAATLADPGVRRALAEPPAATLLRQQRVAGSGVEMLIAPLGPASAPTGTFLATADLGVFRPAQRRILTVAVIEAAIAFTVGVLSAFLLLRRLLRTVGRITNTADRIGRGRLDERLGDQGTDDEVGGLAQSFDAMLDRVESAVGAQRQLLADVSHQLRTPLTVARGHLEVLGRTDLRDRGETRETIELVVDELDHMRALIERMLLLGQAMEPDSLQIDEVDLPSFLGDLVAAASVLADRVWAQSTFPDIVIRADAAKLRGALLNLIDNSVRATGPGDAIRVSATAGTQWLRLAVEDSGPGIPPATRADVVDRFARPGAGDTGGSGLGLAIVKAVAEAHGGRIEVGSSVLGGALVTIVLPIGP